MSKCGWCGKEIAGDVKFLYESEALVNDDGENEVEVMPAFQEDLCCTGCEWAFLAEMHRLFGLSGKELRNHLIDIHGLSYPPGKPAGVMRNDCLTVDIAYKLATEFVDEVE